MKKLLAVLLTVVMLLATGVVAVSAMGEPLAIAVSSAEGVPGDTVTVTVSLANNPGVWGLDAVFQYDGDILKLIDVENGDIFRVSELLIADADPATEGMQYQNPVTLSYESATLADNWKNGTLATLTFSILAEPPRGGSSPIEFVTAGETKTMAINLDENEVPFTVTNGAVRIHTHIPGTPIVTPATCSAEGKSETKCSICGALLESTVLPKIAHTYDGGTVTTAPTCVDTGVKTYTCTVCGATENETIAATGVHRYGAWTVTRLPKLDTAGEETKTCTVCGATETRAIEPIPGDVPAIRAAKVIGRIGHEFDVVLTLEKNPGIWGMDLQIGYEGEVLTLVRVKNGDVFAEGELSEIPDTDPDTEGIQYRNPLILSYEANGLANITANGKLVILTFRVSEDAVPETDYAIRISYRDGDIVNLDEQSINFALQSGIVHVTDTIPGDINGDGVVDKKDSLRLRKYLADPDGYELDLAAMDVTGDGVVDKKDALRLRKYLAGWNVPLGK